MIKCVSGKKCYPSQEIAEEALIQAHSHFDFGKSKGPVAVYQCEECGTFHLTSQGTMNGRLTQYLKEGKNHLQREANRWIDKLNRK